MLNTTTQLASHIRQVHTGGNWTVTSVKEVIEDITFKEAVLQVHAFNTIAALVYHMNYFVEAVINVLKGNALDAKDAYSFSHQINSDADWIRMKSKIIEDAETFAALVEALPDERLSENFTDEKYGSYYRNIQGIIEHTHYHLGQIVILKKLIRHTDSIAH